MTTLQMKERQAQLSDAYFSYEKGLRLRAQFKLQDHELGDDLVQNTFLKTWKYLVRGGDITMMKAFLYRILNCLIIDEYRKKKTVSLELLLETGFEPATTENESFFDMMDGAKALLLIEKLPEPYRRVMHMRYKDILTLEEISDSTGQSRKTVAVQAHRGLDKLRLLYEPTHPVSTVIAPKVE